MARKSQKPVVFRTLNLGDHVRIKNYAGPVGTIVEFRGQLGPNGAPVYRVQVDRKPSTSYIELLASQLEFVPTPMSGRVVVHKKPRRKSAAPKPKAGKES